MKKPIDAAKRRKRKRIARRIFNAIMIFLLVIVVFAGWVGIELACNVSRYKSTIRKPHDVSVYDAAYGPLADLIWVFEHPSETNPTIAYTSDTVTESIVLEALTYNLDYIIKQYDCTDFRLFRVLRLCYDIAPYIDDISITGRVQTALAYAVQNARYWLDEEGDDSACYHSENHQIAYFVCGYMAGKLYEDGWFTRSRMNGANKWNKARTRILEWISLRSKYGFSEFYSENYLPVDFEALSLLLLYGDKEDSELMNSAKATLDLLCLDYALTYAQGTVLGPQGRAYAKNNLNSPTSDPGTGLITGAIWGVNKAADQYYKGTSLGSSFCRLLNEEYSGLPIYEVPEAIRSIGTDTSTQVIKTGSGLNLSDLKDEGLLGTGDKQIMMQFGMGALSNPEVINNTMEILDKYDLYSNDFFTSFKYTNLSLLRWTGALSGLSGYFKLFTNGMAIEKANVYSYRTNSYKLASLQRYNPGSAGAQQTTMQAILEGGTIVYTTNPLCDDKFDSSPGYWGGYGVAPDAAQYENVCILIHRMPKRRVVLSSYAVLDYTHTYFPQQMFDECLIDGRYAFARVGNSLIAIVGASAFVEMPYNAAKAAAAGGALYDTTKSFEIIQKGKNQCTIYEMSTITKEGSFEAFINRVKGNTFSFSRGRVVKYTSNGKTYDLEYCGDFSVDGAVQNFDYRRYQSQYVNVDYLSEDIEINAGGHYLKLNVAKGLRVLG